MYDLDTHENALINKGKSYAGGRMSETPFGRCTALNTENTNDVIAVQYFELLSVTMLGFDSPNTEK